MTAEPKISVVMSVYNGSQDLASAIECILCQTLNAFEFIIVNDGSTDNCLEILREFEKRDARIRVIDQENRGLTNALIIGCNAAKADFIARQDVGDYSHPNRLEEQTDFLEKHPHVGFVSSFSDVFGPGNEYLMTITRSTDIDQATKNITHKKHGPPGHGSVTFRKSTYKQVGGYRSQFYFGQDSDLWLRMAEISSLGFIGKTLYCYKIEEDGISTSQREFQKEFGIISQYLKEARSNQQSEEDLLQKAQSLTDQVLERRKTKTKPSKKSASEINYFLGSMLTKQRDGHARKYLIRVLKKKPLHAKAIYLLAKAAFFSKKPTFKF